MAERDVTIKPLKADSVLTQTVRDDRLEVLVINQAMRSLTRPDLFPWHLSIAVQVLAADGNGMPTADEFGPLNEVSDGIAKFVAAHQTERGAANNLFVAQSTWNRTRELVFRVHNADLTLALLNTKTEQKWKREWEFELVEDPEWRLANRILIVLASEPRR